MADYVRISYDDGDQPDYYVSTNESEDTEAGDSTGTNQNAASAYTFDNYQDDAGATAIYPGRYDPNLANCLTYLILKLNGEAGEAAEHLGKYLRGDYDEAEFRRLITKEVGDVLWYLSQISFELGLKFGDIAAENIRKLNDRKQRGVIRGSGDDR